MMDTYPKFVLKNLDVRTRSGVEWQCLCPYHEDSSPSFSINVRKGLFICYACGAKGNMDDLAQHLSVKLPKQAPETLEDVEAKLEEVSTAISNGRNTKFRPIVSGTFWTSRYRIGDEWKSQWGVRLPSLVRDQRLTDAFCIGYDHIANELIIPIFDYHGSAVSCVRRRLGSFDGPKYLYSKGFKTSHNLYGAWQIMNMGIKNAKIAVVEGTIDALSLWEIGIPAVAILGSNFSATQTKILKSLDASFIVPMTDNDAAGRKASWQIANAMAGSHSIVLKPTVWASGKKDVAEMSFSERIKAYNSAELWSD